ncbi:Hypothetical protein A7982_10276 [Minicystis rosea]|nr:Hypothetical protein A7982_10276 [Minicystis rosea]
MKRLLFVLPLAVALAPSPAASQPASGEERPLASMPIPTEKSPTPKPSEWANAPRVSPTRRGPAAADCRSYLLREWLRVRCSGEIFALSMLGGDQDGLAFWIDPATKDGEVLMPLRRGGRHVVQLWKAGKDAAGEFTPEPLLVVQQHWIDGAPAPAVTLF